MSLVDLATLDATLAAQEAGVPALRKGCEKRVIWADAPATQTEFAVLFIHGFSATSEEIRPLPDLVAQGLRANIHFTRLTGHGQDGAAMATATLDAWLADVAEAFDIAATIGRRVIVMGCSTGCTLATLALARGQTAHAIVHVSPNFGLAHRAVQVLLDLPLVRYWGHLVAGRTRSFAVLSPAHAAFWTTTYPSAAVMARWGGPTAHFDLIQTADDDAMGHVMAGDIFSPGQTVPLAAKILDWLASLSVS